MYYYLSLQYSAIQKTILRHERLWSIAGISQILAKINEIKFPEIVSEYDGLVMVAGGGKFTARFNEKPKAESAKQKLVKAIVSQLPMLEFQVSDIVEAENFRIAKTEKKDEKGKWIPGIIQELNEQKRTFRGYGLTYNPHIKVCEECQEYPAAKKMYTVTDNKEIDVCEVCFYAKEAAQIKPNLKSNGQTSIEKIYTAYFQEMGYKKIPLDFNDLFPPESDNKNESNKVENGSSEAGSDQSKKKRMAVWFSDLNSMNQKVPVWLNQAEDEIMTIFNEVSKVNIDIIANALKKTFPTPKGHYINFRILVAGGDDLCIVMPDNFILDFAANLSAQLTKKISDLEQEENNPLSKEWLNKKRTEMEKDEDSTHSSSKKGDELKPYCFGASFVITSVHTPFKKIHALGEELMSESKKFTREGNTVNWVVSDISFDDAQNKLILFEKPLLIEDSFTKYIEKASYYKEKLSNSYVQLIASKIIEFNNDGDALEKWLKQFAFSENKEAIDFILVDNFFRENDKLQTRRLATLLELVSIVKEEKE